VSIWIDQQHGHWYVIFKGSKHPRRMTFQPLKTRPLHCLETSATGYPVTRRHIPEERNPKIHTVIKDLLLTAADVSYPGHFRFSSHTHRIFPRHFLAYCLSTKEKKLVYEITILSVCVCVCVCVCVRERERERERESEISTSEPPDRLRQNLARTVCHQRTLQRRTLILFYT
jgi:hypothetical protein